MMHELAAVWSPLSLNPLLWIVVTLAAYVAGESLQRRMNGAVILNPVLVAIILVSAGLIVFRQSYATYFAGAQFINFLLGPATVALAAPLARNLRQMRANLGGVLLALTSGALASVISGVLIVRALGGSRIAALSMAPKAATTPVAMAVSQQIGGLPALTASLAIVGGIFAAVVGQRLLTLMRIQDHRAHGLAAGVAGSGVGAAHAAASLGGLAAAFGALGVGLNGVITAFAAPLATLLWP